MNVLFLLFSFFCLSDGGLLSRFFRGRPTPATAALSPPSTFAATAPPLGGAAGVFQKFFANVDGSLRSGIGGGGIGGGVGGLGGGGEGGDWRRKSLNWLPSMFAPRDAVGLNGTSSGSGRVRSVFQKQSQKEASGFSLSVWWDQQTKGSKGILIWLMPALLSHAQILRTVLPFFADRLSQYLQPLAVAFSLALLPPKGMSMLQVVLWSSAAAGSCFMLRDSYLAGSSWLPLEAKEDSFAVITGASSGLGRALAQLLYDSGFNLVLVARRESQLKGFRRELLGLDERAKEEEEDEAKLLSPSPPLAPAETGGEANIENGSVEADKKQTGSGTKEDIVASEPPLAVTPASPSNRIEQQQQHQQQQQQQQQQQEGVVVPSEWKPRQVIIVTADLSEADGPPTVLRELRRRGIDTKIDVLINNAGVGSRGPLVSSPLPSLLHVMDLNVRGTVALTRLLAPRMVKRDSGARILIMGSIASAGPGPDVAVYTASKAFLASFAQSLRRELLPQGVLVTLGLPGPMVGRGGVASSFARASGAADALVFRVPGLSMTVDATAMAIYQGLRKGRDVICPGVLGRLYVNLLSRVFPSSVTGAVARMAWQPPPRWFPLFPSKTRVLESMDKRKLSKKGKSRRAGKTSSERKTIKERVKQWFHRFWYSPVIDYGKIKAWMAYPFRHKGTDVAIDDGELGSDDNAKLRKQQEELFNGEDNASQAQAEDEEDYEEDDDGDEDGAEEQDEVDSSPPLLPEQPNSPPLVLPPASESDETELSKKVLVD